jgi:hypothetical protein
MGVLLLLFRTTAPAATIGAIALFGPLLRGGLPQNLCLFAHYHSFFDAGLLLTYINGSRIRAAFVRQTSDHGS